MGRWAPCGYAIGWFAEAPPRSARQGGQTQIS